MHDVKTTSKEADFKISLGQGWQRNQFKPTFIASSNRFFFKENLKKKTVRAVFFNILYFMPPKSVVEKDTWLIKIFKHIFYTFESHSTVGCVQNIQIQKSSTRWKGPLAPLLEGFKRVVVRALPSSPFRGPRTGTGFSLIGAPGPGYSGRIRAFSLFIIAPSVPLIL